MESPSFYAVIPADVRYADITPNAKLLYGEITCLTKQEGYCWASNGYLAKLYNAGERTVSRWLAELEKAGFITIEPALNQHGQRKIFLQSALPKVASQKWQAKNGDHNNTSEENNTSKGIPPVSPNPTKAKPGAAPKVRLDQFLEQHGGLPPAEWGDYPRDTHAWDGERINAAWRAFRRYWTSPDCKHPTKADWRGTWENWVDRDSVSRPGPGTGGKAGGGLAAALRASVANRNGTGASGDGLSGVSAGAEAGAEPVVQRDADGRRIIPY